MDTETEAKMRLFIEDIHGPFTKIDKDLLTEDILLPGFEVS